MLNRLEKLTQRVGGSNELIDQWLHARKELLVAYCTLVGLKPNKEKHAPLDEEALKNFCHQLVDYLSAGHFHLYDKIIQDIEGSESPRMLVTSQIYPALQQNTETVMTFHDRYTETAIGDDHIFEFHQALSDVGVALDARFQLEDQLIALAFDAASLPLQQPVANDSTLARPA